MSRISRIGWAIVVCSITVLSPAQDGKVVRDLGLWSGMGVEKTIMKDWTFSLKQELRLKKDITEINNYFTQGGISYRINRNFSVEGSFRYTRDKNDDGSYDNRSRYNLDFRYKGKLEFLTIYYRLRYQKEVEGTRILDSREPYEKFARNRMIFRYNDLKKIEPYLSVELFQLFTQYQFPDYDHMRLMAGIRYNPEKIGEINVAYGFNRELSTSLPVTAYIIEINYTFSF